MLAGFIVFAIFAVITGLASWLMPKEVADSDYTDRKHDLTLYKSIGKGIAVICVLLAGLFVFLDSLNVVQAGHAGLVRRMGAVTGRHVGPGVNFTMPFTEDIVTYDTRVQKVPFENVEAASQEYQAVRVTGVLNYRINPKAVPWLFENVGSQSELEDKVLVPALSQNLKAIMPQYPIFDILPNRDQIADEVVLYMRRTFASYRTDSGLPVVFFSAQDNAELDERCDAERTAIAEAEAANAARAADAEPVPVPVLSPECDSAAVSLVNLDFSDEFDASVEEKQVAENRVQTEQNILEQRELQKQQRITEAQGEAEANRLIAESLQQGPEALTYKAIDKLADNIRVIILPEDSPLIPLLPPELLGTGE